MTRRHCQVLDRWTRSLGLPDCHLDLHHQICFASIWSVCTDSAASDQLALAMMYTWFGNTRSPGAHADKLQQEGFLVCGKIAK